MMKMSGRVTGCCLALVLGLTSVTAVQRLNSINGLKEINFGRTLPNHALLLLYWFANAIDIDANRVIRLTFDPDNEDYGSHHYGNYEGLLPYGSRYYTIGNVNLQRTPVQLPDYIIHPPAGYYSRNRDRIIVEIRQQNRGWSQQIGRVYITQHYGNSVDGTYDPQHTYEITTNLLRQLRDFSVGANLQLLRNLSYRFGSNADEYQLRDITNTWGILAGLGLLCFIVIQERQQQRIVLQSAKVNTQRYSYHENTDWSETCAIIVVVLIALLLLMAYAIQSVDKGR